MARLSRAFCSTSSRPTPLSRTLDRKSTRLNSSHVSTSYAVFCLKKNKELNGGSKFKVQRSKFKVQSSKYKVQSSKFKVQSSKFKVQSSKFKVQSSKFFFF